VTLAPHDTHLGAATALVRQRATIRTPTIGIILGSGLGGLARHMEDVTSIAYGEIPGFAEARVPGHRGELLHGTLGGQEVLALAGRSHVYEGYGANTAAFPVRVMRALGASVLLVSNAAGGVRRSFAPGQLVAIEDHVNLAFRNPLIGPVFDGDDRFPDMSAPYDPQLRLLLHEIARAQGVVLEDGVYGWMTGPSYETIAEVKMLERFGVDVVGMSTVPEVIVARASGMRVVGITCVTNPAAGLSLEPIDHAHVIEVTARAAESFERLVIELVRRVGGAQ
jgi:purine-nucleoside phosphorylase